MFEVEYRAFLSSEKYNELLQLFKSRGLNSHFNKEITYYFDRDQDTRLQLSILGGKVWQKSGQLHEAYRQETEVRFSREQAARLLAVFCRLGERWKAVWYRERWTFKDGEVIITLDNTIGYGRILELEIQSSEKEIAASQKKLLTYFEQLGLKPGTKKEFDSVYRDYLDHWAELTKNLSPDWIDL